jgi:DNA-binding Lrp family transcriptional regulator
MRGIVNRIIELLDSTQAISSTEIASVAGISRQAAHKQLRKLLRAGVVTAKGKARACRYSRVVAAVAPMKTHLQVASAGSLYRLSARLLLDGVQSGEVTLDFTGVFDVTGEFLEEVFALLSPVRDQINLKVIHLPARFASMFFDLARRAQESAPAPAPALVANAG